MFLIEDRILRVFNDAATWRAQQQATEDQQRG